MNPAIRLPDPLRYGPGDTDDPLLQLAASAATEEALTAAMREALARRADAEIRRVLGLAPTRETYRRLWHALCTATERANAAPGDVLTNVFAMPLVLVSGTRSANLIPGALPAVGALADLLQRHGAFGGSRNVGFGNALISLEALERLPPSVLWQWNACGAPEQSSPELAPAPISIRAGEQVHLRFLLGAAITPAAAPTVAETAAHIGAWGMPLARSLTAQLAVSGVELLVLPRPPLGVLRASYSGRRAQLEVALHLFMSNAIKRCRGAAGDPAVVVSVHRAGDMGAELRVSLSSAFDETLLEGYRWPLHPLDDPNEVAKSVYRFGADCRLTDIRAVDTVLPEGGGGEPLFVRASAAPSVRH